MSIQVSLFDELLIYADHNVTVFIGVLIPMYFSFKALGTAAPEDDAKWLTYWICYGLFEIVETSLEFILRQFPFYFLFKIGFLMFLWMPFVNGSLIIYNWAIKPIFGKYEVHIDRAVAMTSHVVQQGQDRLKGTAKAE